MKKTSRLLFTLCMLLAACGRAGTSPSSTATAAPVYSSTANLLTPSPIPSTSTESPTPEATETPARYFVAEGDQWAKAGVPVGLEIKQKGNVYYAINAVGQEVELGKVGADNVFEYADALKYKLAATRLESVNNFIPWEDASRGAANRSGKLIGQPFSENVVVDQDVIGKPVLYFKELAWSSTSESFFKDHPEALPGRIKGYFTTEFTPGVILWGKVVEWQTPEGPVYISMINSTADYENSHPEEKIFPVGFVTRAAESDDLQPQIQIVRDQNINDLLQVWIEQNYPPTTLENFILLGKTHP